MSNNNNGWIKLHRSILDWEWWDDRNTRDLFIYCLIAANHDTIHWHGLTVDRGSFVTSLRNLSQKSGLSLRETRTAIQHLISTHELTQQATQEYTIITIYNYERYQDIDDSTDTPSDTPSDTRPTHDRHTTDTRPTHNKNDKNDKNNINIPPYNPPLGEKTKTNPGRFVVPTLAEVTAYCHERNNGIDPQAFIDYYESCGWTVGKKPMKDWKAAVRTWEYKRKQDRPLRQSPSHLTLGPDEYINTDGLRTYADGRTIVPNDAPPRPSARSQWSSTANSWII